jgi:hypothetical protein
VSLRDSEWAAVLRHHPSAIVTERPDGTALVTIPEVALPEGWSATATTVWFVVPVGYPGAMPDCFWADPSLALAGGGTPANSGRQPIGGDGPTSLWFSWHLQAWNHRTDDLMSFIRFIVSRFRHAT